MAKQVKSLTYTEKNDPSIIEIANQLAELEERAPLDSIRRLIIDVGFCKIARLKIAQLKEEKDE